MIRVPRLRGLIFLSYSPTYKVPSALSRLQPHARRITLKPSRRLDESWPEVEGPTGVYKGQMQLDKRFEVHFSEHKIRLPQERLTTAPFLNRKPKP